MQEAAQPVLQDIILVGGGHSHVGVLKRFAMNPLPGVRLTLICRDTHTPYSGMLPGYIAGHYDYDDVHIDLSRLAEYCGARFFRDEVIGLDRDGKKVLCRYRPPVPYDLLSINIGSSPNVSGVPGARDHAVPVKPIHAFAARWQSLLERARSHDGEFNIAVVGAGAGGVELTLAMQYRLTQERKAQGNSADGLHFHLFDSAPDILPSHNRQVRTTFRRVLAERGVQVHLGEQVTQLSPQGVMTGSAPPIAIDEVLWATRASGPSWLGETGLALDREGFIRVQDTLQSETDPNIFAAGDIAHVIRHPREKAGVFAVRQARPLAGNLRRMALGQQPRPFRPQKRWLALISTGDRYAVAARGNWSTRGQWVWRWKNRIDRNFMRQFGDLPVMPDRSKLPDITAAPSDEAASQAISAVAMRCGGCGAKVGSTVLTRALAPLNPIDRDDVLVGLHAPDDAAVLKVPPGKAVVHTVDFFRAFIDDPYVFGKIAANHSLSDLFAMGAEPQSATAIATIPYGVEAKVEDTLHQMMAGAVEVLNQAGCALVGGHTGEGQELALGFAVNGLIDPDRILGKDGLRAGDCLILTKPLGTGTLLAAHARLQAKGRWIDGALASMEASNQDAAQCLVKFGAKGCTDVTGFGLLGHLLEMTRPSQVDIELDLATLPLLDGAEHTVAAGILSSLQPANVRLRRAIRAQQAWADHPRYPLLFDPQTSGGLLAGVPEQFANDCVAELRGLGYKQATIIGRVQPASQQPEPVTLTDRRRIQ
ncbi:selenide, water dikinase SelD [Marinobacter sp. SS21]|uniref:selenide, water dikinase SelD n=1 Tax=Marinobacter sp. SS21 TaxID=2979460 RepID=UPI00232BB47D|nr:selenide, water dikinase SelD [Marinobacter sp. SS21]MDC0664306.1 selenide, water dikinase SelD [Marinobacter sp. SS21]